MTRILLGICCLVLASCLEGDEEVWIHKGGSGRISAVYRLPPAFMAEIGGAEKVIARIRSAVERDPHISLESISHGFEGGRSVLKFSAAFDDFRELAHFGERYLRSPGAPAQATPEELLLGDIDIRLEGLVLTYHREVNLSTLFPENVRRNPGLLGASAFHYTLHMPVAPAEHDASETVDGGRTLKWKFRLREYTDRPMVSSARSVLPLPWWVWAAGVLLLAVALLVIVWAVRFSATRNHRG
jgi:hypothetical protein